MKYLYVGIAILAVILGFCLTTTFLLNRYTQQSANCLREADTLAGQGRFPEAAAKVVRARELWDGHRCLYGVILRHDEADEVTFSFHAIERYAQLADREDFEADCASLVARIDHVANMEKPLFYYVF